jgi:hypothetical protein
MNDSDQLNNAGSGLISAIYLFASNERSDNEKKEGFSIHVSRSG